MYQLMVRDMFSAAHYIPGYKGNCSKLHGHNWTVEVFFNAELLKNGLAIDFKEIKNSLGEILEELDHTNLNDHEWFKKYSPTCENIADYIYWQLSKKEWKSAVRSSRLHSVRIWESENAYAEYSED